MLEGVPPLSSTYCYTNKTSDQILVRIGPDVGSVGRQILQPNRVRFRAYCYPASDVRIMTESGPKRTFDSTNESCPNWARCPTSELTPESGPISSLLLPSFGRTNMTKYDEYDRIGPEMGPMSGSNRARCRVRIGPETDVQFYQRIVSESGPKWARCRVRIGPEMGRSILPTNRVRIGPDVRRPILNPNRVRFRAYCYPASDVRI